jgi:hypothetical protein
MSAPAGRYDTICDQGATYERVVILRDSAAGLVNLTGFTAAMQIRTTAASATVVKSLTTENSGIVLGGVTGAISLFISATGTAAITAGNYVYDVNLISGSTINKPLYGTFTVRAGVTR